MPGLPSEIYDHIIDHLYYDLPSLRACALVGRAMLSVSRYHLFQDLVLNLHTFDLFRLIDLLRSPFNSIAPFAHRIILSSIPENLRIHGRPDVVRTIRLLPRLTKLLPHVATIQFCNSDLQRFPEDMALQLFCQFRKFRNLELVSVRFDRFVDFANLVYSFDTLERVWFQWVTWTHCYDSLGLSLTPSPPSTRWHIYGAGSRYMDMFSWLCSQETPPLVSSMLYEAQSIEEKGHISAFLERCAPSLRHLEVAFPIFIRRDVFKGQ
ncbi:hypothetical protein ONZ45_g10538 [Pleurotus djamor]|nr:hypothetical protein ONZ45_g10538 [Pleurotus djamor]